MNIFIDESGNTGDLVKEEMDLNFAGQKLFVLCAVKVRDEALIEANLEVLKLKEKHKIKSKELKSKKIFDSKPEFILDLIILLAKFDVQLFIEVVDKKFYICTSIVNHQILPPYFTGDESDGSFQLQRNIISDYLARNLTINEFVAFSNSCINLSEESLNASWEALLSFLKRKNDDCSSTIIRHLIETQDDYRVLKENEGQDFALSKFVPIPDIGKHGRKIYLLPQISCLTNIIARVNHASNLNLISFLHDEQKHFDEIILNNVNLMKSLSGGDVKFHYADFSIDRTPNVSFENISDENIFIQVADIISGFLLRYVQHIINGERLLDIYHKIFHCINSVSGITLEKGTGINFVMDRYSLSKLNINVTNPMIVKNQYISNLYYDMDLARSESK